MSSKMTQYERRRRREQMWNARRKNRTDAPPSFAVRPPGKSGYRGVHIDQSRVKSCYRAEIIVRGRRYKLGRFATAEEAARAYDEVAFEAWGTDAHLNFPRGFDELSGISSGRIERRPRETEAASSNPASLTTSPGEA